MLFVFILHLFLLLQKRV